MFLHRRVTPVTERWRAGLSREGHGNMMKTGVSWPAQQDVPEHIAHWRRPMLYLGVCLGATPRRAWPLWPLPYPIMKQCHLWTTSLLVSKGVLRGTTPYLPRSTTCATRIYFSMIFGNGSSQALEDITSWGDTWVEGVRQNRGPIFAVGLKATLVPSSPSSTLHSKFPSASATISVGLGSFCEELDFLLNINLSGQACCIYPSMWAKCTEKYSHWVTWVLYIFLFLQCVPERCLLLVFRSITANKMRTPLLACWFLKTKIPKCSGGSCSLYLLWREVCCAPWWALAPLGSKGFLACRGQWHGDRNLQNTPVNCWE